MVKSLHNQDVVSSKQFTQDDVMHLTHLADKFKRSERDTAVRGSLNGKLMGSLFYQPSTRTRMSTEQAIRWLGGEVQGFAGIEGTSVEKGECLCDTLSMVSKYNCDIIAIRHQLMGSAQLAADHLDIPVVNCGDGSHEHPTQALLDFFTVWEKKILEEKQCFEGMNMVFAGDLKYGRTVHSNILTISNFPGVNIHLVASPEVALPEQYLRLLMERGVIITDHGTSLEKAIRHADVLYVTRVQKEWFESEELYKAVAKQLKLTPELVAKAKDSMIIMHPLPRNKMVREIEYTVDSLPQAHYMQQAENGLYMRMAILYSILNPLAERVTDERNEPRTVESVLKTLEVKKRDPDKTRDQRLSDIRHGTVFDHIPKGLGYTVMKLIRRNVTPDIKDDIEYAGNLHGSAGDAKDVVKTRFQITAEQHEQLLTQIGMVSDSITYNLIDDGKVVRKASLRLPTVIDDVVQCPNPRCVTAPQHNEKIPVRRAYNNGAALECHYCGQEFAKAEVLKLNELLIR